MATRRKQSNAAAAEPVVPMVTVEWLVNSSDTSHEGGGNIGGRRYTGRIGERAEVPEDVAVILMANKFVKSVAGAEQAK